MERAISLLQVLELFPLQAQSIRDELNIVFDEISSDFLTHCERLRDFLPDKKNSPELHAEYLRVLENIQYADIISQRLEHIERGLNELSSSIKKNVLDMDAQLDEVDASELIRTLQMSCRMQQDQQVLSDFIQSFNSGKSQLPTDQ